VLTSEARQIGRSLAGREVWLLATGTDDSLPPGFTEPFARTAAYFEMQWREAFYARIDKNVPASQQDYSAAGQLAAAIRSGI